MFHSIGGRVVAPRFPVLVGSVLVTNHNRLETGKTESSELVTMELAVNTSCHVN